MGISDVLCHFLSDRGNWNGTANKIKPSMAKQKSLSILTSLRAGRHRYPTASGYRPAMFPVRLVAAALAAPPVLSCHTHRSLSSEKCWDSKNNGRPVQSSRRFPYTIRCFSVPQGWVSCYRRILISFRAFQDHLQEIR